MNIYIYSDESGVFDKDHNEIFVFSGLIILGEKEKFKISNQYIHAEKEIRKAGEYTKGCELKACILSNKHKGKLFRSLNKCHKFNIVIKQSSCLTSVFADKKTKQRYLDFAYKLAVKKALEKMLRDNIIHEEDIECINFYVDEHNTATNGRYELRESLEQELKIGTHNWNYDTFYPAIFPNIKSINLAFCNSQKQTLIRAADIIANRVYYYALNDRNKIKTIANMYTTYLGFKE